MNSHILCIVAIFTSISLTGCLESKKSNTDELSLGTSESAQEVSVQPELGECNTGKAGSVVYLRNADSFFTCENNVWVAINLKGEKGDPGKDGAAAPIIESPCKDVTDGSLHYGDRIDGSDYTFNSIKGILPERKYCFYDGGTTWVDYPLSLKMLASAPAAQVAFEESLCKAAFQISTVKNIFQYRGGGGYFLHIKNANMSGKLKRAIICDPDMYGVNPFFPGN